MPLFLIELNTIRPLFTITKDYIWCFLLPITEDCRLPSLTVYQIVKQSSLHLIKSYLISRLSFGARNILRCTKRKRVHCINAYYFPAIFLFWCFLCRLSFFFFFPLLVMQIIYSENLLSNTINWSCFGVILEYEFSLVDQTKGEEEMEDWTMVWREWKRRGVTRDGEEERGVG